MCNCPGTKLYHNWVSLSLGADRSNISTAVHHGCLSLSRASWPPFSYVYEFSLLSSQVVLKEDGVRSRPAIHAPWVYRTLHLPSVGARFGLQRLHDSLYLRNGGLQVFLPDPLGDPVTYHTSAPVHLYGVCHCAACSSQECHSLSCSIHPQRNGDLFLALLIFLSNGRTYGLQVPLPRAPFASVVESPSLHGAVEASVG